MCIFPGFLFSTRGRGAESIENVNEVNSSIMLLPCKGACDLLLGGAKNYWSVSKRSILEP